MESEWRNASYRKRLILSAVIMLAGLVVWLSFHTHGADLGNPRSFNFANFVLKVDDLITRWRVSSFEMPTFGNQGNPPPLAPVYLVIDVNRSAIWIERGGRVAEVDKVPMPDTVDWRVERWTRSGHTLLKSPVYLRMRPGGADWVEMIVVSGRVLPGVSGRESGKYVSINLNGMNRFYDYRDKEPTSPSEIIHGEDVGEGKSILVTPEELQSNRTALSRAGQLPSDLSNSDVFGEDARRWARMADRIRDEVRARIPYPAESVSMNGYYPDPSFTAVRMRFYLSPRPSLLQRLRLTNKKVSPSDAVFVIKYFKDGVWGVCGCMEFTSTRFMVSENPKLDLKPYQPFLERMAAGLWNAYKPAPNFTASYNNGATVELVGLCEYPPNAQSQWWKPDGTPMAEKPKFDFRQLSRQPSGKNERWVAFVFRIVRNDMWGGHSYSFANGFSRFGVTDEYGLGRIGLDVFEGEAVLVLNEQKTSDLTYAMGRDILGQETLLFKNISLHRGEKANFKILAAPVNAGPVAQAVGSREPSR